MQNIIIIQSEIQNARKGIFSPIDPVKANPGQLHFKQSYYIQKLRKKADISICL